MGVTSHKWMKRFRRWAVLVSLSGRVRGIRACDRAIRDVKEALKRSDAVVVGLVLSVEKMEVTPVHLSTHIGSFVRRVGFFVERAFKGRTVSDTQVI